MKKYILILLIFSFSILEAQEFEPTEAMTFTLYHPNTQASFVGTLANTMFSQDEFVRGWQWAHGKRMSEALEIYPYLPIPLLAYLRDVLREE
jgi:hypothetical protein